MLSRDISDITNKMYQLQHKTPPRHLEFIELKPNNSSKQIHYLVKHEDVLCPHKKNYSHPILVDYGDNQFTFRIQDKGNTGTYNSLDSFSFQSVSFF